MYVHDDQPRRHPAPGDRRAVILAAAARVIARHGVRGLRVTAVAAEADVSTALVYYHFTDRAGVLRRTMEFISDRAERYTTGHGTAAAPLPPRAELENALLLELQDTPEVRENSTAWGELRATAVFDPGLREALADARRVWTGELVELLGRVDRTAPATALAAAAERLTATLEGLSTRWLSEVLPLTHARELMREAVAVELAHLRHAARTRGSTRIFD
ncbi:helix-turn-helix domain-containing protein [Streptomyces sp. NPDC047123]|uniref:TetR/AcrR family transcriptional regulator n=1 Tax=Streptomyces sp. NPDC047123 TaxID=3155622 RepID=UPI0034052EB5